MRLPTSPATIKPLIYLALSFILIVIFFQHRSVSLHRSMPEAGPLFTDGPVDDRTHPDRLTGAPTTTISSTPHHHHRTYNPTYVNNLDLPPETLVRQSMVWGYQLNATGVSRTVEYPLITSVIHNFSPLVEQEVYRRFLDVSRENHYCVWSPAISTDGDGFLVAFRIRECTQKYVKHGRYEHDTQLDHVFVQHYDSSLGPRKSGYLLGLGYPPGPPNWDGPQDPRTFKYNGKTYLQIHAIFYPYGDSFVLGTVFWDVAERRPIIPSVKDNVLENNGVILGHSDKNWMAVVTPDALLFVQILDPLVVLSCEPEGACHYVHKPDVTSADFVSHQVGVLRGGTPFQLYRWPYYVGLAHCKYETPFTMGYYTNLILLNVKPYRIVYISEHIPVHPNLYRNQTRPLEDERMQSDFYFPTSLLLESADSMLIGAHVNDYNSFLLRLRGVQKLFNKMIEQDQMGSTPSGPPKYFLESLFYERMRTEFEQPEITPLAKGQHEIWRA